MLIERSPSVVFAWSYSEGWPVRFVSRNVKKLLGYTAEQFMSGEVLFAECIHPDDLARVTSEVTDYCSDPACDRLSMYPTVLFCRINPCADSGLHNHSAKCRRTGD